MDPVPEAERTYGRIGVVARFRPVHRGQEAMLRALLRRGELVRIGIGSANRYDLRNPFTAVETAEMIRSVLAGHERYELFEVPDLGDGPRWRVMVREMMGPLDLFVSGNEYVRELMASEYPVLHPVRLVPLEERVRVDGTMVRRAMAHGEPWRHLVPAPVVAFLEERGLVTRFRREFGLATLALELEDEVPDAGAGGTPSV